MTLQAELLKNGGIVSITAGEAFAANDAALVGPDNLAWKIRTTDTAAVANAGDLSTAALGQIQATTAFIGASASQFSTGTLLIRPSIIQHKNGDIYGIGPNATGAQGAIVTRWTAGGRKVNQVALSTAGTANNWWTIIQLANGNVLAACDAGVRIYDANLTLVNSAPMTWTNSGFGSPCPAFIPLAAGGYVVAFQSATSANIKAGIADNTGAVVVAIGIISAVGGGAGAGLVTGKQLSNGDVVIATRTSALGAYVGVFSSTTMGVTSAMVQIGYSNTGPTVPVEIAVVTGFFALLLGSDSTNILGGVYTNAGVLVGANFTVPNTLATATGQFKLLSNGVDTFYALYPQTTSNFSLYKWTTAAAFTLNTLAAGTAGFNSYNFDAFYEKGKICIGINNTGNTNPKLSVVDVASGGLIAPPFVFGTAATAAGTYAGICSTGDYSFACIYDTSNAVGTFSFMGKYANTAVSGVVFAAVAAGTQAKVLGGPGAFPINQIGGTNGRAFDHTLSASSPTNISGNKGTLLQNSLVLKGY